VAPMAQRTLRRDLEKTDFISQKSEGGIDKSSNDESSQKMAADGTTRWIQRRRRMGWREMEARKDAEQRKAVEEMVQEEDGHRQVDG
jgi:ribonuclease HI